jgi:predicted phosphodiesterase
VKIMVCGDFHGNTNHAIQMVKEAKKAGVKKIIQCGDWGLWSHYEDGIKYLDQVNEACRRDGVKFYVVGGNHEHWDHWDWFVANMPKTYHGFAMVRSHINLAPRVHYWGWEGKKFLMVAGAVSVDKQWRVEGESWWRNEEITDEMVASIPETKVDYFISHDCSNRTPWKGRLKPDMDSLANRQRIDEILKKSQPEMHFHGHMHTRYVWENMTGDDHYTKTIGLDMDGEWDSWGILNIETGEFLFRNEFPVQWN